MASLFYSDLFSWNLSEPSDISTKLFRHKVHVLHCSVGLTSFHPFPTPTSILQTICSNKMIGKDLLLSKPSLKDWDWLSVGNVERWISRESARPEESPQAYYLLYPFRFLPTFRMLHATSNNCLAHFCVAVWTSCLSPLWLIHFTSFHMPHPRASRWMREMPQPCDFCFSDLTLNASGMWNWGSDWQSHLFRDLAIHGFNRKTAGCTFLNGDTNLMLIRSIPQDFFCVWEGWNEREFDNVEK